MRKRPIRSTGVVGVMALMTTLGMPVSTTFCQDGPSVLLATGINSGLAVVVGTTDGALESTVASGKLLVQGITTDPKVVAAGRIRIARDGKFPLANITEVMSYEALPYGPYLANLVIADLDRLGESGPSLAELKRIIAYNGKGYIKQNGAWKVIDNPKPADVDEWPNQWYDAKKRPVSKDMRAGMWSALKWISGPKKSSSLNPRIEGGQMYVVRELGGYTNLRVSGLHLIARDAFSGVLLWRKALSRYFTGRQASKSGGGGITAHNGKIFGLPADGSPLTAWDGRTGNIVKVYDKTVAPGPIVKENRSGSLAVGLSVVLFHQNRMFYSFKNQLWALDEASGGVIWQYQEPNDSNWLWQPVVGDDGDVYSAITVRGGEGGFKDNVDGHLADIKGLVRLRGADGSVVWRNVGDEFVGTMGQFLGGPGNGLVPMLLQTYKTYPGFVSKGMDGIAVWAYSMATGARVFRNNSYDYNWSSAMVAMIGDKVNAIHMYSTNIIDSMGVGIAQVSLDAGSSPPGCMSVSMTPHYIIRGPSINNRPSTITAGRQSLERLMPKSFRPECGELSCPAYGQLYSPPSNCGCTWYLPGDVVAYKGDPVVPVAESKRRLSGADGLEGATVYDSLKFPALEGGPIVEDWYMAIDYQNAAKTSRWGSSSTIYSTSNPPVPWYSTLATKIVLSGDLGIMSRVHQNCIVASRNGKTAWTFLAGGRVSVTPVVQGALVLFGCHDGYVYALDAADGSMAWRYFAAPMDRRVVAYGQVESAWPLYGIHVEGTTLYYIAGRSSGIDDGMVAGALELPSGAAKWRIRLATYSGENLAINTPITTIDGKLAYFGPPVDPANPQSIIKGSPITGVSRLKPEFKNSTHQGTQRMMGSMRSGVFSVDGRLLRTMQSDQSAWKGLGKILPSGRYMVYRSAPGSSQPEMLLNVKE